MIESTNPHNNLPEIEELRKNKKLNPKRYESSPSIILNDQSKYMNKNTKHILQPTNSGYYRGLSKNNSKESLWDNKSELAITLNSNDFSYRNEKKYYQLLEKHRLRQDKIKSLSTRTPNLLSNNELGIKNIPDTADRLPKITNSSYQALSGFCQKNCPLPSAKEIINIKFSDEYEKEYKRKKRENQVHHHHHKLKKTISCPVTKTKNIPESINNEIKEMKGIINNEYKYYIIMLY